MTKVCLAGYGLSISNLCTFTSPNIARSLTLRSSPSDYSAFNQIKKFWIINIRVLLENEKQPNVCCCCCCLSSMAFFSCL